MTMDAVYEVTGRGHFNPDVAARFDAFRFTSDDPTGCWPRASAPGRWTCRPSS
jgi:hypothetical protein